MGRINAVYKRRSGEEQIIVNDFHKRIIVGSVRITKRNYCGKQIYHLENSFFRKPVPLDYRDMLGIWDIKEMVNNIDVNLHFHQIINYHINSRTK